MEIPTRSWALSASVCGFMALVTYMVALAVPLSGFAWHLNSFSIGILLGISIFSVSRMLEPSILSVVGGELGLMGGVFMSYMLIQQHGMHEVEPSSAEAITAINNIQLSTDVAFDLFIGLGLALLCIAMMKDARFGRLLGGIGLTIQVLQVAFNLAAFPDNPGAAGLIDMGPIAAAWLLVLYGACIRVFLKGRRI